MAQKVPGYVTDEEFEAHVREIFAKKASV
jgi:hypothetical protein